MTAQSEMEKEEIEELADRIEDLDLSPSERILLDDVIKELLMNKNEVIQKPIHKNSKAPKLTINDLKNFMNIIIRKQRGIDYNPKVVHQEGANQYIKDNPGYRYHTADLDNDPRTPNNVIVYDSNGIPIYIDGYSIVSGEKRIKDYYNQEYKLKPKEKQASYRKYLKKILSDYDYDDNDDDDDFYQSWEDYEELENNNKKFDGYSIFKDIVN
jgi:hypothetical protein